MGTLYRSTSTKSWYTCLGAYIDGSRLVPVKIGIDERVREDNRAHFMITFSEMEIAENNKSRDRKYAPADNVPTPAVFNVPDILRRVNPTDYDFLEDVPDQFLNDEQIHGKSVAMQRINAHTLDRIVQRARSGKLEQEYIDKAYREAQITGDTETERDLRPYASKFSREDVSEGDLQKKLRESERARAKLEKAVRVAREQAEFWRNESSRPGEKGIRKANARDIERFARAVLQDWSAQADREHNGCRHEHLHPLCLMM